MKKRMAWLLMAFLVIGLLSGCAPAAPAAPAEPAEKPATEAKEAKTIKASDLTVGFIYVGPIGDGGWSFAHNAGRLYLEKELGVKTLYKESVPESQDVEKVAASMIDQGAKVIFATSFGYMDYVEKLSKKYPDVIFLHCSGYKSGKNMNNYFGRMEEPRFLSGLVAGMKTQSNKLGYVAAYELPEVVRGINAFTLGVQAVNPKATVEVVWTHTWYDPAKEKEAAIALLDHGCDVIAQHQDTAGPQQAAEERGKWSVGYDTDMRDKAPKAYLTAPVWNWGPYYVDQVKKVLAGTWTSENYWGGMKDGIVELAPLTANAPKDAQAKVDEYKAKIMDGSLKVFQGPIYDQTGTLKVKQGETVSDADQLKMDWFVKGVIGKIETKK